MQFTIGLPKSLSASTNLESAFETLDYLAITGLSDWQASKAYATLTGKKTMCTPRISFRSCDVRACDSGRLTHEIRPQTVPSISFRLDFLFFCPHYVFLKNSRYSDASVAYRRFLFFFRTTYVFSRY